MGRSKQSKHRPRSAGRGRARLLWAPTGRRLFGPDGREYRLQRQGLTAAEVRSLLSDAVPLAVKHCGAATDWVPVGPALSVWHATYAAQFGSDRWAPPAHAPGALPYRAELWQVGTQRVLLLTNE